MTADERHRRSRRILWVWAFVSLVTLGYVGFVLASSVAVTPETHDAFTGVSEARVTERDRLVIATVASRADVVTLAAAPTDHRVLGARGDVIRYTFDHDGDGNPPLEGEPLYARALVYVERAGGTDGNATWNVPDLNLTNVTTVTLTDVPVPDPRPRDTSFGNASEPTIRLPRQGFQDVNITVNLSAYAGSGGFIVKPDASAAPQATLVPAEAVTGKVVRAAPAVTMWAALAFSVLGAVFPVAVLVTTRRGHTLATGAPDGACAECRFPLPRGLDFCERCGAYRER